MHRDIHPSFFFRVIDGAQRGWGAILTWFKNKSWPSGSGMLWPIVVAVTAFFLIQTIGQLRALGGALVAAMRRREGYYDGGFAPDSSQLVLWWATCLLVVLASSTFSARQQSSDGIGRARKYRLLTDNIALHVVACVLVLSPLFAAGLNPWQLEVMASIVTLALLTAWVSSLGYVYLAFFIVCMMTSIALDQHNNFIGGAIVLGVWGSGLIFHPNFQVRKRSWLAQAGVSTICAAVAIFGLVFGDTLLARQIPAAEWWDKGVLFLACWWLLPAVLVMAAKYVRVHWRDNVINAWIIGAAIAGGIAAAWLPASIFGLNTLCLLLAGLLAAINLVRNKGLGFVGRAVLYSYMIAAFWKFSLMEPTPDFSKEPAVAYGVAPPSRFHEYYKQWLTVRGENAQHHGPLILVSVAGGGIRAAAHASVALSLADDVTGGKFGERTLMISAVSGGALGTATWLARRVDGMPTADSARIRSGGVSPSGLALSRFYRNDFLSPVVNRMLFHDLPLALWPGSNGGSDRDLLLQQEWEQAWDALLRENSIPPQTKTFFRRKMSELSASGELPLIVFNTTSAADGRSAVYSSFPGAVRWSWQLDPNATVGRAVLDSARFAGISPVGVACAEEGAFDVPRIETTSVKCRTGSRPLAVADGGYRDNAGLAEIAAVVDELARDGDPLDQVFVIQITSNPEEGLRWIEGTRFSNGKLLPELLAPAIVQESARSRHPEAYIQQLEGRGVQPHIYTWGLPHNIEAESFAKQPRPDHWIFKWLNQRSTQAEWQKQARLPPLGWTMDPDSYEALYRASLRVRELPVVVPCGSLMPQYGVLCKSLEHANGVSTRHLQ